MHEAPVEVDLALWICTRSVTQEGTGGHFCQKCASIEYQHFPKLNHNLHISILSHMNFQLRPFPRNFSNRAYFICIKCFLLEIFSSRSWTYFLHALKISFCNFLIYSVETLGAAKLTLFIWCTKKDLADIREILYIITTYTIITTWRKHSQIKHWIWQRKE